MSYSFKVLQPESWLHYQTSLHSVNPEFHHNNDIHKSRSNYLVTYPKCCFTLTDIVVLHQAICNELLIDIIYTVVLSFIATYEGSR